MNRLLREQLQSAVRDLCILIRVILTTIVLGLVWYNDLNVTLGTKRATLKQRHLVLNTSLVNILPCSDVIQSVSN